MDERDTHSAYQRAGQIKERYEAQIMAKANVVGVGVGLRSREGRLTDEVALVVMVSKKYLVADLPAELLFTAMI